MEVIKTEAGSLSILTGKTDMGKSTISVFNCSEQLKKGASVLFISYEYCQSMIYNKLIAHFDVKWQDLLNIDVLDGRELSFDDIVSIIKKKKGSFDVVYIDYIDLVRNVSNANESVDNRIADLQKICSELAVLAKDLNIKICALSQESADSTFENTVAELNNITATVPATANVIKMFIGRDEIFNPMIKCNDISHVVLVDGNNLKHFASINIKETYKQ